MLETRLDRDNNGVQTRKDLPVEVRYTLPVWAWVLVECVLLGSFFFTLAVMALWLTR